ncbi:hypothetical protein BUALT_Bualt18G0119900 [Buddleja alternifolia]|uniref:non-specific serine/threonine protein kinase n=1 Tax=Buddleja alternifolia TaxID=168488 RepID=A0AAV6WAN3_9LAMI|nr:hypothetical protein BUALT_Bualt18G0119900 [Buddleja alternifolia]
MLLGNAVVSWILAVFCLCVLNLSESQVVPQEEVEVLQQIANDMGSRYWRFNAELCEVEMVGVSPTPPSASEGYVECNCNYNNSTVCHVTKMNLEANNFSEPIPSDIGRLINLKTLILSSNRLTGQLPTSFSNLINLNDFRINDNRLSGRIPDFIQNWNQVATIEMQASGLEGPIPSNISLLSALTDLRISDLRGPSQEFPVLRSATGLVLLKLRNCNISGEIPAYIWRLRLLQMLGVSFNKLVGQIPNDIARNLKTVLLTGNMLSGSIPYTILKDESNIDLSYNNFTLRGPDEPACRPNINRDVSLFKGSLTGNTLQRILPCSRDVVCPRYKCSLHVNCGGNDLTIKERHRRVIYEGDKRGDPGGYLSNNYWGFTSTGDFLHDTNYRNSRFIEIATTTNLSGLYSSARLSPISLTYYHYCLENGSYNVSLHFAEILFTNDGTYNSLGRRLFDIYIQENLVWKDFNIEDEARGAQRPVIRYFNATVHDGTLEIRFYWASKGTTRIPNRGDYGSLISAISVNPNFKVCSDGNKKNGVLPDGTVIAVKQLSSRSKQGNREFLNEIGMISCVQHPNLVKLLGCCTEEDQLLVVYEYMENNSIANALLDSDKSQLMLDWPTRFKICIGIARGLAFLHEESRFKIVHRDIKATNVLLDKDLNPKISDFGLARLNEDEKTHISTKVAGTIGYMAPEYALWGYLTDKVDIYSFGVVILEIVSGKSNHTYIPSLTVNSRILMFEDAAQKRRRFMDPCSALFRTVEIVRVAVGILQQIANDMGSRYWRFNAELCEIEMVGVSPTPPSASEGYVQCNCNYNNNTVCHVTKIVLKSYNLPGILPPDIGRLPYIQEVSVLVNRLSGEIPRELGNITSLTYLNLEANNFSEPIPSDIGRLINLKTLILSSNRLTGQLPTSFSNLINLNDFRINDNRLSGRIPDFIQNWNQVTRMGMQASGLEGPIPLNISLLSALTDLRISDLRGPSQQFPVLRSTTGLAILMLRNCNISGEIPAYIWRLRVLLMLDVSFNKLVGQIPNDVARNLRTVFLTGNMLSGSIPHTILKDGSNIDLSYNNFTLRGPGEPACQPTINRDVSLFKGSLTGNTLQRILPCSRDVVCPRYKCSLHVNCGGNDLTIKERNRRVIYEGDDRGDPVGYLSNNYWGFTSTGDFLDETNYQTSRSIGIATTTNLSGLYSSARLSPLSLTYYHYCLENGSYNVSLHFAEILFTNDRTYNSLGRRMFDIYIQENLVRKDFNIEDEARGAQRPVIRSFNATVHDGTLEIRFYWASKGTTRIPNRGDYGSLISAISVNPNFKVCSDGNKKNGVLPDGTVIAVKQLSSRSKQGNREFLNEIGMISCVQHPNLVKLLGCCTQGDQLLVVYEYMENNSLANALFDSDKSQLMLDWPTRGYMAPEYALWGYLTDKADVYSFGVVILEIVSGKSNNNYMPRRDFICLLDWASHLQESKNIDELVDERLASQVDKEEVERIVKVAILCTNSTPSVRPTMSEVVRMIEGDMVIPNALPEGSTYTNDVRFKAIKDFNLERSKQSSVGSDPTQSSTSIQTDTVLLLFTILNPFTTSTRVNKIVQKNDEDKDELVEGKVDWKGNTALKHKHGGKRTSFLILGTFAFENMATMALAVNLVTYFTMVMHFDLADAANELTNYMGVSYILTILVAFLADTYAGRFKAVLVATSIEFLASLS